MEDRLVEEIKKRNSAAFEQCYHLYAAEVYTAILKICQNPAVASEILQETFLDVYKGIDSYMHKGQFIAWIKKIAFNKTINVIRKRPHVSNDEMILQAKDPSLLPELVIENENLLEELMQRLTETERTVLWLYVVEQYQHDEIAIMFGKTKSFSKSIVARALNKIKATKEYRAHA